MLGLAGVFDLVWMVLLRYVVVVFVGLFIVGGWYMGRVVVGRVEVRCVEAELDVVVCGGLLLGRLMGDYLWPLYVGGTLYMVWYIFRAMRNMYGQHRGLTFLKYLALGFAYIVTAFFTLLLTLIFLALYG